jgi:hypothetical protein
MCLIVCVITETLKGPYVPVRNLKENELLLFITIRNNYKLEIESAKTKDRQLHVSELPRTSQPP